MSIVLLVVKTTLVLGAVLLLQRLGWFTAAQRHILVGVGVFSLPLVAAGIWWPAAEVPFVQPVLLPTLDLPLLLPELVVQELSHPGSYEQTLSWAGLALVGYITVSAVLLVLWTLRVVLTQKWLGERRTVQMLPAWDGKRAVPLQVSTQVTAPMTWGVWRPVIIVPHNWREWSAAQQRAALTHELAHVQRKDTLTMLAAGLVGCLFWWQPLYWIAIRLLGEHAERACDDKVLETGTPADEYAGHLVELARAQRMGAALSMASPHALRGRIRALLDAKQRRVPLTRGSAAAALGCSVMLLAPISLVGAQDNGLRKFASDGDLMPIVKVGAVYPAQARDQGIEGYVVVEFRVDADGATRDAQVVEAQPPGVFEAAALRAVGRYKYKPRVEAGVPVAVSGIRNRLTFALDRDGALSSDPGATVPAMSEPFYRDMAILHSAIDEARYDDAQALLEQLRQRAAAMNGNEVGQLQNLAGYLAFKLGDFPSAISAYEGVLEQSAAIPQGLTATTLYTLAQLNFVVENFDQSLHYIQRWRDFATNEGPIPLIFMAQVHYRMQDYPAATERLEEGLAKAEARNVEVRENWWKLLSFLYFEQERWADLVPILENLNRDYPNEEYKKNLQIARQAAAQT